MPMSTERNPAWLSWFILAFSLTVFGLISLFSVCHGMEKPLIQTVFGRQLLWMVAGMILFWMLQHVSLNQMHAAAYAVYGVSLILLIVVFAFKHQGVHRWIVLGPIRFQPSETAKIGVLLMLARVLSENKAKYLTFKTLGWTFLLVLCPIILILKEPDLGTSIVFVVLWMAMIHFVRLQFAMTLLFLMPVLFFVAGFWPWLFYPLLLMLVIFLFAKKVNWPAGCGVTGLSWLSGLAAPRIWEHLAAYQKQRILIYMGLQNDPRGGAYQVIQSKLAIGSGGFWGKGLLQGSQTQLRFLPEQHTDFIFSVPGEAFGFAGSLILLSLFAMLFVRGILIAAKIKSRFAGFVLAGCVVILSFQTVVNIAMTVGMVPVTGLPLPFLSYGGSAMCMSWILCGLMAKMASQRQI